MHDELVKDMNLPKLAQRGVTWEKNDKQNHK